MNSSELLKAASRLAESKLARVRILKNDALATIVPPGSDGKLLVAVEGPSHTHLRGGEGIAGHEFGEAEALSPLGRAGSPTGPEDWTTPPPSTHC